MNNKILNANCLPDLTPATQMAHYMMGLMAMGWYSVINGSMLLAASELESVSSPGDTGLGVQLPAGE